MGLIFFGTDCLITLRLSCKAEFTAVLVCQIPDHGHSGRVALSDVILVVSNVSKHRRMDQLISCYRTIADSRPAFVKGVPERLVFPSERLAEEKY
jgi:hypothetical protein